MEVIPEANQHSLRKALKGGMTILGTKACEKDNSQRTTLIFTPALLNGLEN